MKHVAFNDEMQKQYDTLPERVQKYIDFIGAGNTKVASYQMAGFTGKNISQSCNSLERNYKCIKEMIDALRKGNYANAVMSGENDELIDRQINALATQKQAENMMSVIANADAETAKRIKFYRDITNGKIKTIKTYTDYDKEGNIIKTKVEEIDDVNARMSARKELDKVLGLNAVIDVGSLKAGDITINIVDASKREEIVIDDKDVLVKGEEDENKQSIIGEEVTESTSNSSKAEE